MTTRDTAVRKGCLLCLVTLGWLTGCGPSSSADPAPLPEKTDTSQAEVLLKKGTVVHVLTDEEQAQLTVGADGALAFAAPTEALAALEPGHLVVGAVSKAAPLGLLVRVTAKLGSKQGGALTLTTERATLEDVFETAQLRSAATLDDAAGPEVTPLLQGLSMTRRGLFATPGGGTELSLERVVLHDEDGDLSTSSDQVTASGRLSLAPSFSVDLSIKRARLQSLHFDARASIERELSLDARAPLFDFHKQVAVATLRYKSIVFKVGIIPVVITPVVTVYVGIEGSLAATTAVSVSTSTQASLQVAYESGEWSARAAFPTETEVRYAAPQLGAEAQVALFAGPKVSALFYGFAGPFGDVFGLAQLEATLPKRSWSLSAGLHLDGGVEATLFGRHLAYTSPAYRKLWPVKSGSF